MRKLILHIGIHKTGTSTLQKTFFSNLESLERYGWDLFCVDPRHNSDPRGNANSWVDFTGEGADFRATWNSDIYQQLGKQTNNLLISSEELAWVFDPADILAMRNHLSKIFDDIKVVMYIRRQDKQLYSHFQQGFKYPHSSARKFYGYQLTPLPDYQPHFDHYLNYHKKYLVWSSVFGAENLIVKVYERKNLINHDIVDDFSSILGMELTHITKEANATLSKEEIVFNHLQEIASIKSVKNWYTLNLLFKDAIPFLPAKQQAEAILEHYAESNDDLNKILRANSASLFSPIKADEYPETGDSIEPKDIANLALKLNTIANRYCWLEKFNYRFKKLLGQSSGRH